MSTKRITIYIKPENKRRLDEIKYKYHLSYSTIINILAKEYFKYLGQGIMEHYYDDKKGLKTSIKPNTEKFFTKNQSILYTNAVTLFCTKMLDNMLDKSKKQKLNTEIYNEFQNTYEENWDGNRFQRIMPRMLKQNRDYYKRILENEKC